MTTISLPATATSTVEIGATQPTAFSPASLSGLKLWLDASDSATVTKDGGNLVSQWNDKSGNGKHATASGGARPTHLLGVMNFSGGQYLNAGGVSDFTFLHELTGATVVIVSKASSGFSGSIACLLSTQGPNGFERGVNIYYDRAAVVAHSIRMIMGTGSLFVAAVNSSANSYPQNTMNINAFRLKSQSGANNDFLMHGNAGLISRSDKAENPGAGDQYGALTIGRVTDSVFYFDGQINEVLIWNRNLTLLELERVRNYLAAKWSASITALPRAHLFFLGGSDNAVGHGAIAESSYTAGQTITNANIWNGASGQFEALQVGVNNRAQDADSLGPEVSLCDRYVSETGESAYLIKYGVENTELPDWLPSGGSEWAGLSAYVTAALTELDAAGYRVTYRGTVWYAGEEDADSSADLANYTTGNLTALWDGIEGLFGSGTGYVAGISQNPPQEYENEIKAVQQAFASANRQVKYVDPTWVVTGYEDAHHIDAVSQERLGNVIALDAAG